MDLTNLEYLAFLLANGKFWFHRHLLTLYHHSLVVPLPQPKFYPSLSAKGDAELAEAILAIARDYEVPIYENAELVRLLARLELGDAIPEALYRTIAEIIAFAWHLKGKCPEGFAPDAADGNQMLLLGGPGD